MNSKSFRPQSRVHEEPNDVGRERLQRLQQSLAERLTTQTQTNNPTALSPLVHLESSQLEAARETLLRKRKAQTAAILSRTAERMGRQFGFDFRAFAACHHFNGSKALWKDAIAFAAWERSKLHDPSLREILIWEGLLALWHSQLPFFRLQTIRWDLLDPNSFLSQRTFRRRRIVFAWRWKRWGAFLCM